MNPLNIGEFSMEYCVSILVEFVSGTVLTMLYPQKHVPTLPNVQADMVKEYEKSRRQS
jgi:hypothetical protein